MTLDAVRRVAGHLARPDEHTDAELLGRYVAEQDGEAFAALVRRHGPMVFGVCRRVLGDWHLAEDAFQAAFVVLARKAAAISPPGAVAGFLHGIAHRVAKDSRRSALRRFNRERPVGELPDSTMPSAPDTELRGVLDDELRKLPGKYRDLLVACDLEGRPRQPVAEGLGIPEGTLSSRLTAARKMLAERLAKRGIALPATLTILAHAAVSSRLAAKTSALATPGGAVPAAVACLTNGVFRTMLFQKLTLGAAVALLLAIAGFAALSALPDAAAKEPVRPPVLVLMPARFVDEKKPQPVAKPAGPGTIVVARDKSAFWVVAPDGKKQSEVEIPDATKPAGGATISPDGKRVAFVVNTEQALRPPPTDIDEIKPWPFKIVVRSIDKPGAEKSWDMPTNHLTVQWTADGKKLVAAKITNPRWTEFECVLLDPDTGKTEKLNIPANARVVDCGKDGKTFVVQTYDAKAKKCELGIVKLGDKEATALCDLRDRALRPTDARLSPDGKKILFIDADPERKDAHKWGCSQRVYLIDVATKKREALEDFPDNARAFGIAWSPDGKKLAYTWVPLDEELLKKDRWGPGDVQKETEGFLIVADADGKNAKTVASDKGMFALAPILGPIDWK